MLQLKGINKSFGDQKVLKNINLEIDDGEFVVLVGPSGCGKSTLVRIIAGLEREDNGVIIYNNSEIQSLSPKARKLAMVFQNYALYPHKTVYENIAFPLKIGGLAQSLIDSKVHNIATKLGLLQYLKRKPKELSGGQRQRVALARAMAKEPEIFLLDEPLSNLDAKLRMQMRHELFKMHKESKATFIYVTHDQVEALSLGDKIVVLKDGEIQQVGFPEEIYHHPANIFVASFIGSPGTNILDLNTSDNLVGIRPEFLSVEPGEFDSQLEVLVSNIEMLGPEYLIYGTLDKVHSKLEQVVLAKVPNTELSTQIYLKFINSKERVPLSLQYSQNVLYYFNRLNEENICNNTTLV